MQSGENDSKAITRRDVLRKSAGSVAVVGLGSTGAAGATGTAGELPELDEAVFEQAHSYFSGTAVREALETHASDELADAVEAGLLDSADPGVLPVDTLHDSPGSWVDANEGATVFATERNGEPSPKIEVKTRLPDGRTFKVAVRPEEGESYSTVRESSPTDRDAGTASPCSACWYDVSCERHCIEGRCESYHTYCCCDYTCELGSTCSNPVGCSCQDICSSTGC